MKKDLPYNDVTNDYIGRLYYYYNKISSSYNKIIREINNKCVLELNVRYCDLINCQILSLVKTKSM